MDERALVQAMIAGDRAAWDRFLREFGQVLIRAAAAALSHAGATGDAEDVAQKVLTLLLESDRRLLRSFQGHSTLSTWIIGIARRQALTAAREDRRKPPASPRAEGRDPLEVLEAAESADHLARAMGSLPARERLILRLHYDDGLPYDRIAETLGVSINSVSPLLERARERLRRALGETEEK